MSTEPAYDVSNVHLAQGRTAGTAQFHAPGPADPENGPIPCTLTPKAEADLNALTAELSPAEPEPEASR